MPVPRQQPLVFVLLGFAMLALFGCASTSEAKTGTSNGALQSGCDQQLEQCKTDCRAVPDSGSRGPCFNSCLKQLDQCRAAE